MVNFIFPTSVYLTELVNILSRIWNNLVESPYILEGIFLSTSIISFTGLLPILASIILESSITMLLIEYSFISNVSLPDSIFDISRILFIISSMLLPADAICDISVLALFSSKLGLFKRVSLNPTIAFIGDLISWDILDKKSDLALFDLSISSLTVSNSFIIFKSGFSMLKYKKNIWTAAPIADIAIYGKDTWRTNIKISSTIISQTDTFFLVSITLLYLRTCIIISKTDNAQKPNT